MCSPLVIGGVQAYGQIQQGNYEAKVENQNAQFLEGAAGVAQQRGGNAAGLRRMKGSQDIGEARASAGASGLDVGSGSVVDMIADSRMLSELDAQTETNNAAREAWGYKVQATEARARAKLAKTKSRYNAAATLLGGLGSTVEQGAKMAGA